MRFLFVHQNFPGQYLHVLKRLVSLGHEVVFITQPSPNHLAGVRVAYYERPALNESLQGTIRDADAALRRAEAVAHVAANLKRLGFVPDIIIGHHGWGELLSLVDVFPGAPILGYFEFYYRTTGQDVNYDLEFPIDPVQFGNVRAMNIVNMLALGLEQHGQTPTRWQLSRYPDWAQTRIKLLPEGADLTLCRPDPKAKTRTISIGDFRIGPKDRLVTYVARNLEPYRGFHTMMRALPELLRRRDVKVVMVGGDDVSYGGKLVGSTWREHFQRELSGKYDTSRVLMPGQVPYETYLSLLQRSDVHVYLTYPFVLSWSLREAMAMGCAIVGADVEAVREVITERKTGLLTPGLDPSGVARRVLELLDNEVLAAKLRQGARRHAEKHLDLEHHLAAFMDRIAEITGQHPVASSILPAGRREQRRTAKSG